MHGIKKKIALVLMLWCIWSSTLLMLQVARDYNDQNIKATQCNFSRIDS